MKSEIEGDMEICRQIIVQETSLPFQIITTYGADTSVRFTSFAVRAVLETLAAFSVPRSRCLADSKIFHAGESHAARIQTDRNEIDRGGRGLGDRATWPCRSNHGH